MTGLQIHIKNSAAIFSIAVIYLISATSIFTQCEGVYFKPTGKTIADSRVYVSGNQEDLAGDMNGDGKLDLVTAEYTAQNVFNKLFIYPGDGTGGFGARTEIALVEPLYSHYRSYYIRDFNGDNKLDLIVRGTSNFVVYLNNGGRVFTPQTLTPATAGDLINAVDINNDSRQDLIVLLGGSTYYRLGNANGSFGDLVQFPQINFIGKFGGDFDGDGDLDFASTAVIGTTQIFRVVTNNNGVFSVSNQSVTLDAGNNAIDTVGDVNNDGKPDVIISNAGSPPKMTILLNQGNGNFTKTSYNRNPSQLYFPSTLGDFNGDGFVDIFTPVSFNAPTGYVISLNNGAGVFTQRTYLFGSGSGLTDDRLVGDFTGDGKPDFIRINNAGQSAGLSMSVFNETQFTVRKNVCNKFGQPKIVDFDRDGKTDQTFWRASDGRWRFLYNGNSVGSIAWGAPDDKLVPGDYDGDGATDAAVFRNGVWYILNSSNNSMIAVTFGAATDKPIPADYNGDGRTDVAVFRPSNGTWYFLISGTNQFSAAQFGIAEDVPLPEDYDGDEKADIAVFRPSQGKWYILRSSDNSFYGVQWGLGTDKPYPADYDGDGKADLCVRRESSSNWYILRSSNNQSGALLFGFSTDIAQTGDWDGNGIMDIGVYRPSTGKWYATSLYGAYLPAFGEAGEIPVASIQR